MTETQWLPAITEENRKSHGCLNCEAAGMTAVVAPMDMLIAVGFGDAGVTCDGRRVWEEPQGDFKNEEDNEIIYWTVADAEKAALGRPEADWRIFLDGPMSGRAYQRQGAGNWVLVEQDEGFFD